MADDEEERPKLQLGEETTLDDLEEEEDEVDTDTELAEKAKETISLNL